jgi:hypothetical protein
MLIVYIVLILLGSFPLLLTLKRIHTYRTLKKRGTKMVATITHIRTQRYTRGLPHDRLTLTYYPLLTGRKTTGQVATVYNKYKVGDQVEISIIPKSAKIIIPDDVGGFMPVLGFSIALLVFIIFATYKIRELVPSGY